MKRKKFTNGFASWQETHFEIVSYIMGALALYSETNSDVESEVFDIRESQGTTGLYELAEKWTDEFELLNKKREWDGEFYEEVEMFAKSKDFGTDFQAELAACNERATLRTAELHAHKEIVRPADSKKAEDMELNFDERELLIRHRLIHYDAGYRYFVSDLEEIKEILSTLLVAE